MGALQLANDTILSWANAQQQQDLPAQAGVHAVADQRERS